MRSSAQQQQQQQQYEQLSRELQWYTTVAAAQQQYGGSQGDPTIPPVCGPLLGDPTIVRSGIPEQLRKNFLFPPWILRGITLSDDVTIPAGIVPCRRIVWQGMQKKLVVIQWILSICTDFHGFPLDFNK